MPRNHRGTAGNDAVTGASNQENVFTDFGIGADNLTGGNKDDTFVLSVDQALDVVNGGSGVDTLDYSAADRGLDVDLEHGWTRALFEGELQDTGNGYFLPFVHKHTTSFTNIENVVGSRYDDQIYGNNADNVIEGGAGADLIDGGNGTDTASYAHSSQGVTVNLGSSSLGTEGRIGLGVGGDAAGDILVNVENVIGSQHADTLIGNRYDNVFTGGNGADTFVFERHSGRDTITDFRANGANQDHIELQGVFRDYDDLRAHMTRDGNDVLITIDDHNSIRLEDVRLGDLSESDFYLV